MHAYSGSRSTTSGSLTATPGRSFPPCLYRLNISVIQSQFPVTFLLPSICMIFIDYILGLSKAKHVFFSRGQLHKYP